MNLISKIATAGAVAAMGLGLGAAGASAGVTLDNSDPTGAFTGSQTTPNVFSASGLAVECSTATFAGNSNNSDTTFIPFHAEYSGCEINLAGIPIPAEVTTHSDWRLHYQSGTAGTSVTANVDVLAPASGPAVQIEVTALGCSIDIPAQSGLSHVVATNVASPTAVDIAATVTGISYTSNCPGVSPVGTDGAYDGDVRIEGITMT